MLYKSQACWQAYQLNAGTMSIILDSSTERDSTNIYENAKKKYIYIKYPQVHTFCNLKQILFQKS